MGVEAHVFDASQHVSSDLLCGVTHLLISIPPDRKGGGEGTEEVLDCFSSAIEHHRTSLKWIGYLSTTGVYGDREGAWVMENDELRPTSDRGRARLAAEQAWFELGARLNVAVHSFRLAGIYGPGRNQLAALRGGTSRRIVKQGHVFSRIHVDDIATVLEASMARPRDGAAYNVCDDEAAPAHEVVAFAASLAGIEAPPEIAYGDADLTPMARSFYEEHKRVSNDLIKHELGVTLRYPTYREGLRALWEAGE